MSIPEGFPELTTPASPPRTASGVLRLLAALAGLALLVAASLFTVGGAAVAALGVLIAYAVAQRQGRQLTRRTSWFVAVSAAAAGLLIVAGIGLYKLPSGSVASVKRHMDSASVAEQQPPPAWLERMAPGTAARSRQQPLESYPRLQSGMQAWAMTMAGFLFVVMTSVFIGSAGWLCGLLIVFAAAGRWLPRHGTVSAVGHPTVA